MLEELVLLKQYELRELDLLVNVSAKKKEMNECNEKVVYYFNYIYE